MNPGDSAQITLAFYNFAIWRKSASRDLHPPAYRANRLTADKSHKQNKITKGKTCGRGFDGLVFYRAQRGQWEAMAN